jgi:integrase
MREVETAGPMAEAIVAVLLNTGLRVDELVRLGWESVRVQPRSGWIDVAGKGDKRRRLPLNNEARTALEAIAPESAEHLSGAIFRGKRGPYTARGIEYLLAELGRRANVPHVHPHRFRHDTGRRLVEAVDLPTVAAWLGHEHLDAALDAPARTNVESAVCPYATPSGAPAGQMCAAQAGYNRSLYAGEVAARSEDSSEGSP